jgi:hypothetical protein
LRRCGGLLWTSGLPAARGEKNSEDKILLSQNFKKLKTSQQHCNQTYITNPLQQLDWILHARAFSIRGKRDEKEG